MFHNLYGRLMPEDNMKNNRGYIANSLVHLTKETGDESGLDVLCKMLNDGVIKGSGKSGYIKDLNTATCFTETPLSALKHLLQKKANLMMLVME